MNPLVVVDWTDIGSSTDPSNLSSQIVDFSSWEWWVADDWSLKISCEELLDLSSTHKLCWCHWGQLNPLSSRLITHKVGFLVTSCAILFFRDHWGRFVVWFWNIILILLTFLRFILFGFVFLLFFRAWFIFRSFPVFYLEKVVK